MSWWLEDNKQDGVCKERQYFYSGILCSCKNLNTSFSCSYFSSDLKPKMEKEMHL